MKAKGKITIEEGLILNDPELIIKSAFVEAVFIDSNGDKHSRLMPIDLATVNVSESIQSNEVLSLFE